MPNLTVAICTRNRAALLGDTLRSLLAQSLDATAYEIVVVDDGSTDATSAVVQAAGNPSSLPAIRYVRQDHAGLSAARNRSAREASGELVCYVDDDVEVDPSCLEAVVAGAERHPQASCFAGRILLRCEAKPPSTCEREYLAAYLDEGDEERTIDRAVGANMTIRKRALTDVGGFNEALRWQWDELEWQHRLRGAGGSIVYLPQALVWHRRLADDLKRTRLLKNRFRWGACYPDYARVTNRPVPVWPELRHAGVSLAHGVRRRCFGGLLMVFYRLGVLSAVARNTLARLSVLHGIARRTRRFRHAPRQTTIEFVTTRGRVRSRFKRIYASNSWRGEESRSGPGSSLDETQVLRRELGPLLERVRASSLLDIPCGDFNWMKEVELPISSYVGADILGEVVQSNQQRHGSDHRHFVKLDLLRDRLPAADVVLCRDGLDHLSLDHALLALANIRRSGARFLLATTYPARERNDDIRTGAWRPLNLERSPFNLPPPIELITEGSRKPSFEDKSLGLWRVEDFPAST